MDSRNIETLSWLLLLFARIDIQSLSDHCKSPSNFFVNSSMISWNRSAPSASRGTCRSNRIMAFDTTKQSWRNLSGLMSIHFHSRSGIDMETMSRQASVVCSSILRILKGMISDVSGYIFVDSVHDSNPWSCSVSQQRFDPIFNSHPRLDRLSYFRLSALLFGMLFHLEAMYTLDTDSSFHLVLRIVLFRQCSNQRQSTVWITSGLQIVVRIYAENLAAGFPACWNVLSKRMSVVAQLGVKQFHHVRVCRDESVSSLSLCSRNCLREPVGLPKPIGDDRKCAEYLKRLNLGTVLCTSPVLLRRYFELIYRNNRAKNQFNVFFATFEVNRVLSFLFAGGTKYRMTAFCKVNHSSAVLSQSPSGLSE